MNLNDLRSWLAIGVLLGAGLWLGRLENRISQLETNERYLHGAVVAPKE